VPMQRLLEGIADPGGGGWRRFALGFQQAPQRW
jgi:hypothetical protein